MVIFQPIFEKFSTLISKSSIELDHNYITHALFFDFYPQIAIRNGENQKKAGLGEKICHFICTKNQIPIRQNICRNV